MDVAAQHIYTRIKGMFSYLARWRLYCKTRNDLYALTAKELNDIGINRDDIDRIAYELSLQS